MKAFLDWFETKDDGSDPVLRAAIAHLWFVTIHPFDDDYGRIARAVAAARAIRLPRNDRRD
jgi:Fic family protein